LGPERKLLGDTIVGAFCDVSSLLYYSAPLAKMADIIKKKDSLGLHFPTICASFLNCSLWCTYGFAINEITIYFSNIVGGIICLTGLVLCRLYPASVHEYVDSARMESMKPEGSRNRALTNSMGFNTYVTEKLINETDNKSASRRDSFLSHSTKGSTYDNDGLNHYVQNELHVQKELLKEPVSV
jgi:uncharacterized protein with PQ loop repeat